MKICLINNLYEPYNRGGAEVVVHNLAQGLRQAGNKVLVITVKPFTGLSSLRPQVEPKSDNLKIYRFYPLNFFSLININRHWIGVRFFWHLFDVFNLHSYWVVKKILDREKPDLILTHNLKGLGYLIPRAVKQSRIKWLHTIHDVQLSTPSGLMMLSEEEGLGPSIFFKKVYERICRWLFDSPTVVISPSRWLLKFYLEKGFFPESKMAVLPNPVVFESTPTIDKSAQAEPEAVTFLYLGQMERAKGAIFLAQAFKEYFQKGLLPKGIELRLVGAGSQLEAIKKIVGIEPRIVIIGPVTHEKINQILNQANFILVPSLCYENSPMVISEGLAFGLPLIVARIGGATELIKESINGLIFNPGDEVDLLRVVKQAIADQSKFRPDEIRKTIEPQRLETYLHDLLSL